MGCDKLMPEVLLARRTRTADATVSCEGMRGFDTCS